MLLCKGGTKEVDTSYSIAFLCDRATDPHDLERQNGLTLRGISLRHGQRAAYQAAAETFALASVYAQYDKRACLACVTVCDGLQVYVTSCCLHM